MDALEKIFHSSFEDALSFKKIGAKLIARQLAKEGITLSQEQLERIEAHLENVEGDSLVMAIDNLVLENDDQDDLVIQLDDFDGIDEIASEITKKIANSIPDIISETSGILLNQLKRDAPKMLKEHKEKARGVEVTIASEVGTRT